jgi:hypothetical protein
LDLRVRTRASTPIRRPAHSPFGFALRSLRGYIGINQQNNLLIVKYSLAFVWSFVILGALSGRADDILPPRFDFDRYARTADHAPFAVATAVALPEATADFAKDLYVANAAHSSEGDMATIMSSSDQNFKKYLNTKEPVDGYSIASIEWSEKVGETKVTIGKDGKFATLTFNQALLSQQAPPDAPAAPDQMPPGVPSVPSSALGEARVRSVIQRNPKAAAVPTPNLMPVPAPDLDASQVINPQQELQHKQERRRRKAAAYRP